MTELAPNQTCAHYKELQDHPSSASWFRFSHLFQFLTEKQAKH